MSGDTLKPTQGPYYAIPSGGGYEIMDDQDQVVAMAHELPVAALMASSTELLDGLIEVQETIEEIRNTPHLFYNHKAARTLHEKLDVLDGILSRAFEKIHAEAGG